MCAVHDVKHNIVEFDFVGMFMLKPVCCKEFVKYLLASVKNHVNLYTIYLFSMSIH